MFVPGPDTVDASGIDTSALGHSYIAAEPLLLKDLFMLMRYDLRPLERNLRGFPPPPGQYRYWFVRALRLETEPKQWCQNQSSCGKGTVLSGPPKKQYSQSGSRFELS